MKKELTELKTKIQDYFSGLEFNEEKHLYHWKGERVKCSVSKIVDIFVPFFDTETIAKNVANKRCVPVEQIKKEWKENNLKSTTDGTATHLYGENYVYNKNLKPKTKKEESLKRFIDDLPPNLIVVFTELEMYDLRFKFAGTADLILYDLDTGKFIVCDYKTNKDLHKNYKGQKMLPPFDHWLNTPLNHYVIQLSCYKNMIEQVDGVEVQENLVIYLKEDSYEIYSIDERCSFFLLDLFMQNDPLLYI